MEELQIWPPAPKVDQPQIPQKPRWSVWDWMGVILAAVVLGGLLLTILLYLFIGLSLDWAAQHGRAI